MIQGGSRPAHTELVLELLEFGFIQRALVSGVAIACLCSFVGCFLVMRRLALFGDGISHVAFGGVAAGFMIAVYPWWTAFVFAVLGSLGLQKMRHATRIPGEVSVAVALVTGLAVGVVLISIQGGFTVDLFSFLFGSIILVGTQDMIWILSVGGAVGALMIIFYKYFLFTTFHDEMARVSGIRTVAVNYLFVALAAVTVVTAMRLTGILLVTSLIVLPTMAAARFNRDFKTTIAISAAMSSSSVVSGIFVSYVLDWAPSGTIVLILVLLMLLVYAVPRLKFR